MVCLVSTHSRPKAAGSQTFHRPPTTAGFNTQPPEGGWPDGKIERRNRQRFNTQPPEGGWAWTTRSPKPTVCFNTQPPEGGWPNPHFHETPINKFQHTAARRRLAGVVFPRIDPPVFQHTAARRRLVLGALGVVFRLPVSTHSRPKAAGITQVQAALSGEVSTHSRPKAAGDEPLPAACPKLGFNTQPPEGGWPENDLLLRFNAVSTHSRPKAAGQSHSLGHVLLWFQHTAARRRLARQLLGYSRQIRFNTQPPEGGWGKYPMKSSNRQSFNTQPPEGGWAGGGHNRLPGWVSTHSRPKAAGKAAKLAPKKYGVSTHSRPKAAGADVLCD